MWVVWVPSFQTLRVHITRKFMNPTGISDPQPASLPPHPPPPSPNLASPHCQKLHVFLFPNTTTPICHFCLLGLVAQPMGLLEAWWIEGIRTLVSHFMSIPKISWEGRKPSPSPQPYDLGNPSCPTSLAPH